MPTGLLLFALTFDNSCFLFISSLVPFLIHPAQYSRTAGAIIGIGHRTRRPRLHIFDSNTETAILELGIPVDSKPLGSNIDGIEHQPYHHSRHRAPKRVDRGSQVARCWFHDDHLRAWPPQSLLFTPKSLGPTPTARSVRRAAIFVELFGSTLNLLSSSAPVCCPTSQSTNCRPSRLPDHHL